MDEDDDPPVDRESAAMLAQAIARTSKRAAEIVRDHAAYFDEVLPTVLLADVGRWYRSATSQASAGSDADRAVHAISDLYETGNESMHAIVATGFLESLPQPGEEGREVVEHLPPRLREELRVMESWRPG